MEKKKLHLGCQHCGGEGVDVEFAETDEKAVGNCLSCGRELWWLVNPAPIGMAVGDQVKSHDKFGG